MKLVGCDDRRRRGSKLEEEEDEDEDVGEDVDVLVDDVVVELVEVELVARYAPAAAIIIRTMTTTARITLLIPIF